MTKTVKITSRGRYVCPDGKVLFGPMGNFYKEDTATLKALLLGYPNIEILERTASKKLVNINITNFNTNNDSAPVSMMEDNGSENENDEESGSEDNVDNQNEQAEAPVEEPKQEKVEETVPVTEETPAEVQEQTEQPVEEAPVEVQTQNEQAEAPVEEPQQEELAEAAPAEEAPVTKEETKQPAYTSTKKDKKRHNKSTEVTPKEA